MQYVQLTAEFIAKAIQLFSGKKITEKKAKKITKLLVNDNTVAKTFFCGAECTKSKLSCMKAVKKDGESCHVHDPARKCHGITNKKTKCGSVAKTDKKYCRHHEDQDQGHLKSTKTYAKNITKKHLTDDDDDQEMSDERPRGKKSRKQHTPQDVVDSEDESDEEVPAKKKHAKKAEKVVETLKKDSKKSKRESSEKAEETVKHSSLKNHSDEIIWERFPYEYDKYRNSIVLSKPPNKKDICWQQCSFDKSHGYSTNYVLNGHHLLKRCRTDVIVAQLGKMPSRDDFAYLRGRRFDEQSVQMLVDVGFTVQDMPRDYKPPLSKEYVEEKTHGQKTHSNNTKQVVSSVEEKISIVKNKSAIDITSPDDVPLLGDINWVSHPKDLNYQYATNYAVNGLCIVRIRGRNIVVALATPNNLLGIGKRHRIDILDRSILSAMGLSEVDVSWQLQLDKNKPLVPKTPVNEILVPTPPTIKDKVQIVDKSTIKWKRFGKELEYAKNLLVAGKHILKKRREDVVVGLVTDEHISSEYVVFDRMSFEEIQQIFTMGFIPDAEYMTEELLSDEDSIASDEEHVADEQCDNMQVAIVENAVVSENSHVEEEIFVDIRGTAAHSSGEHSMALTAMQTGSTISIDGGLFAIYKTEDEKDFLHIMGTMYGDIKVLRSEIAVGEFSKDNVVYEDLRKVAHEMQEYYHEKEAIHLKKYGTLEPHHLILAMYEDTAQKNKKTIIAEFLEDIVKGAFGENIRKIARQRERKAIKDDKKKQKRIRNATCETDEE